MNILRLFFQHFKADLCFISLLVSTNLFAQTEYNAGLRFYNKYDFPSGHEYSSLDISWEDPIPIEDEVTLSFDFILRNAKPFGFFFHLKGDSLPHSMLTNVDFKDPEMNYLEFGFRDEGEVISFPIPKAEFHPLKWFHISITYNFLSDEVEVILNHDQVGSLKFPMLNTQNIQLLFGYLQTIQDVPSMTVKNIKIHDKNGLKHHWPLNEYDGEGAYDRIGGRLAKTTNTQWEYASHTNWVLYDTLELDMWENMTLNESAAELILVSDQMRKFMVEAHGHSQMYPDVKVPYSEGYNFYFNPHREMLYGFFGGKGNYFSIDLIRNQVTMYPSKESHPDQYHSAARYYDPDTHELYWVGGYGWYTSKNHIQKFDFAVNKWDTLAAWGDSFDPRFSSAVSRGPDPNSIYIFGGTGNKSGMQERGWQMYKGLWEFDKNTLELRKRFDVDPIQTYSAAAMGYSKALNQFMIIYNSTNTSPVSVLILDPESGEVIFHDDIPGTLGRKIDSHLRPIIGHETGKLIVATLDMYARDEDERKIHIHTINYPPMHPPQPSFFAKWDRLIVGGGAFIIAAALLVVHYRRSRMGEADFSPVISLPRFTPEEDPYTQSEFAIQCFGNFKIYQDGEEIPSNAWTSKKARSLLVFVLLKNKHGVTPHEITNTFWPEANEKGARNSRYVAMSQIRSVLGKGGSILVVKDHNVYVDMPEGFFSDIHYLYRVMGANSHADVHSKETVMRLMGDGQICHDIESPWMDDIRTEILTDGKRVALSLSHHYLEMEAWEKLADLGVQILHWDSIDDEGLLWAMKGLTAEGHTAKAKSIFDGYTDHYYQIIDEPFGISFQDYLTEKM